MNKQKYINPLHARHHSAEAGSPSGPGFDIRQCGPMPIQHREEFWHLLICNDNHGQESQQRLDHKSHKRLLSERQFQTESSVVRGNTLHHTDGHGSRGVQGEIAQAGTGRGPSM